MRQRLHEGRDGKVEGGSRRREEKVDSIRLSPKQKDYRLWFGFGTLGFFFFSFLFLRHFWSGSNLISKE